MKLKRAKLAVVLLLIICVGANGQAPVKPPVGVPFNYMHPLNPIGYYSGGTGMILPLNEESGVPRIYLGAVTGAPTLAGTDRLVTITGTPSWHPYPGATAGRSLWGGPVFSLLSTTLQPQQSSSVSGCEVWLRTGMWLRRRVTQRVISV
jgi:hypothetical protein